MGRDSGVHWGPLYNDEEVAGWGVRKVVGVVGEFWGDAAASLCRWGLPCPEVRETGESQWCALRLALLTLLAAEEK